MFPYRNDSLGPIPRPLILALGLGYSIAGAWHFCSPTNSFRSAVLSDASSGRTCLGCYRRCCEQLSDGRKRWEDGENLGGKGWRCSVMRKGRGRSGVLVLYGGRSNELAAESRRRESSGDGCNGAGGAVNLGADEPADRSNSEKMSRSGGRDGAHASGGMENGQITHDDQGGNEAGQGGSEEGPHPLTSALELMETLMKAHADVRDSLWTLSPTQDDENRVVSDIARPVVQYAKRYKSRRVEYEKRQEAKKLAEKDPYRNVFSYEGEYDEDKEKIDMSSRYGRIKEKPPEGWDEHGPMWQGIPKASPGGFSKRSMMARARWSDPAYREAQLKKRKKKYAPRKKKEKPAWMTRIGIGSVQVPTPGGLSTVDDIDNFLKENNITAVEAARAYAVVSAAEERRRRSIKTRYENPTKWMDDRLAKGKTARANLNNPEFFDARKAARSLKAKKSYEKRRLNGNAGWRPKSAEHQEKMEKQKVAAAYAVAQLAAGVVPKRKQGRRASKATMTRTIAEAVRAWMSASAAKFAADAQSSTPPCPDLEAEVKALAISKTEQVLATVAAGGLLEKGATPGSWANETASIALEGVDAWRLAWEEATASRAATAAAASGDEADTVTRKGLILDTGNRLEKLLQLDNDFSGAVSERASDEGQGHSEVIPVVSHGPDDDGEPDSDIATANVVGVVRRRRRGRPREPPAEIPHVVATKAYRLPRPEKEPPRVGDRNDGSPATVVPWRPGRPRSNPLLPLAEAVGVSGTTAEVQNSRAPPAPLRPRVSGANSCDVGLPGVDGAASSHAGPQGVGVWQEEESSLSFALTAKGAYHGRA